MTQFADTRKDALKFWKVSTKRIIKVTDNFNSSIECVWQDCAFNNGYHHISIFCSLGEFVSHFTDLLRDYRYDKYEFDQSNEINEILYRYYSRILLITSEILTDFQDLYILADNKLTTKQIRKEKSLKLLQDRARKVLSNNSGHINDLLDYINRICKHKISNFHLCNNHIEYLFEDFHKNIRRKKRRIELRNINNFTSYNDLTFEKKNKAEYLVVPSLNYIVKIIMEGYIGLNNLFAADFSKFEFICKHFEDK